MKNTKQGKQKKPKTTLTVRTDADTLKAYNEKLIKIYQTENHRKNGETMRAIMRQFTKQDDNKLRQYLTNQKDIINLNLEDIESYKQQLQDKDKKIEEKEKHHLIYIESIKENHKKEMQNLNDKLTSNELILKDKESEIERLNNEIEQLKEQINAKDKTITKITNKREHTQERLEKLHDENRETEKRNKHLELAFKDIQNMSLINRILGKYPENVKMLAESQNQYGTEDKT